MAQNPIDGSIYYTNIFDGTIKYFSFYDDTLGINESNLSSINFYPNPIENQLNISGIHKEFKLDIYNISGQLLFSNEYDNRKSIPIKLNSGLYIAKLSFSSGKAVTRKIVVK